MYRELAATKVLGELSNPGVVNLVREALAILQSLLERNDCEIHRGYQVFPNYENTPGRPRFDVPHNQLAYLLEVRFTVPQIADILGVSVRTVRRRMAEYDLSVHILYSQLLISNLME